MIGGKVNCRITNKYVTTNGIEVLQLGQKLVTGIDWQIPNVPEKSHSFRATQTSTNTFLNDKLLLCGDHSYDTSGIDNCKVNFNQYLIVEKGEQILSSIGNMSWLRTNHSTVFMNGSIFSCGSTDRSPQEHHEEFRLEDKIVKERKRLPIKLLNHSATEIDQKRYMVTGGKPQVGIDKM